MDDTDLESYKSDCESLPSEEQNEANSIAMGALTGQIHAHLARGGIPYDLVDDYPGSP